MDTKQQVTNTFTGGLNTDLHPLTVPNNILTDCVNGTIITYNGNEYVLQNDTGNIEVPGCILPKNYIPVGIKEYKGILYIVSYNPDDLKLEIGSFPSVSKKDNNSEEGILVYKYGALKNTNAEDNSFNIDNWKISPNSTINIECQPSYDGSINLIINDGDNSTKIVNTGFAKLDDNTVKILNNVTYKLGDINKQINLFQCPTIFPSIELKDVTSGGQLKCGNYTFYFKYGDKDENTTDIIGESGIISIFKGTYNNPSTISGGLQDELTDKLIILTLREIDTSFSKLYVSYKRETSDTNGINLTKYYSIVEPYNIDQDNSISLELIFDGTEETTEISGEELNIQYNVYDSAKTITQIQNMLFLGNTSEKIQYDSELQEITLNSINIQCIQDVNIGYIDPKTYTDTPKTTAEVNNYEYYNPINIYNYLGYWPNEYYRFGIVYVYSNGKRSSVYNIPGGEFEWVEESETIVSNLTNTNNLGIIKFPKEWKNLKGTLSTYIIEKDRVSPYGLKILFNSGDYWDYLLSHDIIAFFIVRQKRNPNIVAQGISIGVDNSSSYAPLMPNCQYKIVKTDEYDQSISEEEPSSEDEEDKESTSKQNFKIVPGEYLLVTQEFPDDPTNYDYFLTMFEVESFIGQYPTNKGSQQDYTGRINPHYYNNKGEIQDYKPYDSDYKDLDSSYPFRLMPVPNKVEYTEEDTTTTKTAYKTGRGLLCLDAQLSAQLQSLFSYNNFILTSSKKYEKLYRADRELVYLDDGAKNITENKTREVSLIYIPEDTPIKYYNNKGFSTKNGSAETVQEFGIVFDKYDNAKNWNAATETRRILRGTFTPFLGCSDSDIDTSHLYNICLKNLDDETSKNLVYSTIEHNNSPYFAISDIYSITNKLYSYLNIYRGDCFTNTVSLRFQTNLINSAIPLNNTIIDRATWKNNFDGKSKMSASKYNNINLADLNTVQLGTWITYKCLSNYNLGLRSIDQQHAEEISMMGSPRSFYPLSGINISNGFKMPESSLLNQGYSAVLSDKKYFEYDKDKYINTNYTNRIAFSNVQISSAYTNGYRIFQGLSYKDIESKYGSIIKLLPYGNNIFCVFEHGCAIIPINEKALMTTTTGQSIHLYGDGVLPEQVTIISPDYGSYWADSIIRTPNGFYGVDTSTKKIWKFNDKEGFTLISDLKIQKFINENLILDIADSLSIIGIKNVATHYNNFKGDVMFTFYTKEKEFNICYNERLGIWVCKYSWVPLLSSNIDNTFYSFNKNENILPKLWEQCYNTDISCGKNIENYVWQESSNTFPIKLNSAIIKCSISKIISDEGYILTNNDYKFIIKKPLVHLAFNSFNYKWVIITFNYEINNVEYIYDMYIVNNNNLDFTYQLYVHNFYNNNNVLSPTKWYNTQYPFEFEFVVNTPLGINKIFNNLAIISNNVEPNSLEIEIIGDAYQFIKEDILSNNSEVIFPKVSISENKNYQTTIVKDKTTGQYNLNVHQDILDIKDYGRRIGNISYIEDKWNLVLSPIYYSSKTYKNIKSTRIRDKYAKIRIKYTGEKLAMITLIQTLTNLSYS